MANPYDEDFGGLDSYPNLDLKKEPGSLLDYLRVRWNRVMKSHLRSMPGLQLYMEMSIHNTLVFQLEHELTRYRSEVSELMNMASKWIDRWSEKRQKLKKLKKNLDLSMDRRELNKIKFQLTESLLERLEQLKKAMDDIDDLQKILSEKESEIASL